MEQTPAPPPQSTQQPPPEQQHQPPASSLAPPPQPTVTSTSAVAPTTSAALPTTAASSVPTTTPAIAAPATPSAPSPAPAPSSSNPNQPNASAQSSQLISAQSTNPQARPLYNRPWQQQQPSPFSHYSLPPPPLPLTPHSSSTNSSSPSLTAPPPPRGGMAIGVPAHHPATPPAPPASFSSLNPPSYGQPFSGLGRNVTDSGPASSSSQVRQPIGGMQGIGMIGSLGSSSAMRPSGIPGHQLRPVQLRPQPSPSTHSPAAQNFQGHGMLRVSSVGSPASPSPNSTQGPQPQNQPWLSSGSQGKHPLPPTSLRPQLSSQSMAQRSHIAQQHHHPTSATSQQQQVSTTQQSQQPQTSAQPQEQYGQQFPQSRIQQSLPSQQQIARGQGSGIQRPQAMPSPAAQTGVLGRIASAEPEESCNRILSKRSIQELVAQIDPSEKLDPEVEDILVDIADDFVESITTFGCSLAKHRKSSTLETKDILLHLERNWNITLPGFGGDEIKTYKKPPTSDIHRERLAVIKKSVLASESTNSKSSAGQTGGNPKSHIAKGPTSFIGSPNPKLREPA